MKKFLFLLTILLITSCQKDELIPLEENAQENLTKKKLNAFIKQKIPGVVFLSDEDYKKKRSENDFSKNMLVFKNLEELGSFIDTMNKKRSNLTKAEITHYWEDTPGVGTDPSRVKIQTFYSYGMTHNILFSRTADCSGSGITSTVTGINLGVSYDHLSGDTWAGGRETTNYFVEGQWNYNFFVEGIGTFATQYDSWSGRVNCRY